MRHNVFSREIPHVQVLKGAHQTILGADKGCGSRDLAVDLGFAAVMLPVAQNIQPRRHSVTNGRTVRHAGHAQCDRLE
jgi:hypothetical protein